MNIWWRLRYYWHKPQMINMCRTFKGLGYFAYSVRKPRPFRMAWRFVKHNLDVLRWRILSSQPLCCKGRNDWQTNFCDWLEERARALDSKREETDA